VGSHRLVKVLRILGWCLLGIVLAVYVGLPVAMAVAATWPARAEVGTPPAGFSAVSFQTADGVTLNAWYAPSRNGATVIVAHGAGGSRSSVKGIATMLAKHDYGVLSLDLRGHGTSEGRTNRFGWAGTRDVQAAVDFLTAQDPETRIGAVGSSMGGEVLLGASAECPTMTAIVADGATRRSVDELLALPAERGIIHNFTARVMFLAVRLLSSDDPPTPLLAEMQRAAATSYLLIAAGNNKREVAFNEVFAETLGERATLWIVPGVGHTGALARYPAEYEQRVIDFLDERLLESPAPTQSVQ